MAPPITERIDELWKLRLTEPDVALEGFEALLAGSAALAAEQRVRLLIGRLACLAGTYRLDQIPELVQEARALLRGTSNPDPELESELYRCEATVAFFAERLNASMELSIRALELAREAGARELLALAHSNIAAIFGQAVEYRSALQHLKVALQLTRKENVSRYAVLLNNLGNSYLHLKRTDEALACFQRARNLFSESRSALMAAIALVNLGRTQAKLLEFDKAISTLVQAIGEFRDGNFTSYVPSALSKLAVAWASTGETERAEECFREATEFYDEGLEAGFETETRQAYAEFLLAQDRAAEAINQLELTWQSAGSRGTADWQPGILQLLAAAYEQDGRTEKALEVIKEFIQVRDKQTADLSRAALPAQIDAEQVAAETEHEVMGLTTAALLSANRQLAFHSQELEQLAMTDHLTGLHNRRFLMEALNRSFRDHRTGDSALSLVMLDIDQFKKVNDTFSHVIGDVVLQKLAKILLSAVRTTDVVARWGGEEFVILLAKASPKNAADVVEKLRKLVENHDWEQTVPDLRITISLGVAFAGDHPELDAPGLIDHVDTLLYKAKRQGGNRVGLADEANANPEPA